MTRRRLPRALLDRACAGGSQAGYTLFELLVVMVILGVVLIGLTTSFTAGLRAESGTVRRALAQENARLALTRMRIDVHCASAGTTQENPFGGFTITLTESPNVCPSVTTTSSGVQWCTIPVSGSSTQWQLFRFLGTVVADCNGDASSTLVVDYLVQPSAGWASNSDISPVPPDSDGNLWPTPPTCSTGNLPAVAVRMAVNPDSVAHPNETYDLSDTLALRNAPRCT